MTKTEIQAWLDERQGEFHAFLDGLGSVRAGRSYQTGEGFPMTCYMTSYGCAEVGEVLSGTAQAIEAVLTQDGHSANLAEWHQGEPTSAEWVFVERWTPEGRVFHGYVDPESRKVVQTG
jgi:hypothetical protein